MRGAGVDPITFEVLRHRLWAINDEAGATIRRISGSPVATEAYDFNTGLLTAQGDMLLVGIYISAHASVQDIIVRYLLDEYGDNPGIGEDDMFITGDPYVGALHQSDVTCIAPIHWQGEPVAWCGCTVHQVAEHPLTRAGPVINRHGPSPRFVLREFSCPGCGTMLEVEVNLAGSPLLWDTQVKG